VMDVEHMREVLLLSPKHALQKKGLYVSNGAFSKFNLRLTFMD